MGPIERDLQARKEEIRSGELVSGDYRKFNKLHDINTYAGHYILEDTLIALLDELEEEHKTEIPQPVDADGVPWTGEEDRFLDDAGVEHIAEALHYSLLREIWFIGYREDHYVDASYCRHVKPKRTLEEIVKDINTSIDIDKIGNVNVTEELLLNLTELHEYLADDAS